MSLNTARSGGLKVTDGCHKVADVVLLEYFSSRIIVWHVDHRGPVDRVRLLLCRQHRERS